MVDQQQGADGGRRSDVGDQGGAGESRRPRRDIQVGLADRAERPSAADRDALPIRFTGRGVHQVVSGAEEVGGLVVRGRLDHLLERAGVPGVNMDGCRVDG
ncbi:hypothetical protein ACN3XK_72005, partial [Actinomadura welshii]